MVPNSENTQFKPGQSGNPDGRPKGSKNLSTMAKELLAQMDLKTGGDGEYARPLLTRLAQLAFGNKKNGAAYKEETIFKAVKELMDRADGQSEQNTNLKVSTLKVQIVDSGEDCPELAESEDEVDV